MRRLTCLLGLTFLGLSALSLTAQENATETRMGVGLAFMAPLDSFSKDFDPGFQAGLHIHFNRQGQHLGRLRLEYLKADRPTPNPPATWNRMEGYGISYEWLPHVNPYTEMGLFGIFGLGGTLWNETWRFPGGSPRSQTHVEHGFTLSAGAGWRFNSHVAVETRFVLSDLTFASDRRYGSRFTFLTLGGTFRF